MPNNPVAVTRADVVRRAQSMIGKGVYKLSKGGRVPSNLTPLVDGQCDCSGFVAWCLGVDRYQPGKVAGGDWIETSAVAYDAVHFGSLFSQVWKDHLHQPGDLIVYGDSSRMVQGKKRTAQGHIGVVETVDANGRAEMVIDCASGRGLKAVGRRPASFFFARGAIVARFKGLAES